MTNVLKTAIGPLCLDNPIIMASGTFGYGVEYVDLLDISRLGGISVKGISLQPRAGNATPRICETAAGMLNSIGLANVGYDVFVSKYMPALREAGATVIVNCYGTSPDEFAELAERFSDVEGIAALEINISCPNVKAGGIHFGVSGKSAGEVTAAVRRVTSTPLIVKLSPEAASITDVAKGVADAGADAVSLINTFRGMAIDVHTRKPRLGIGIGGLSGPAIKPLALRMVYEVARDVDIPVIGMGGIGCLTDVLEFLIAGASAVQIGTACFSNPTIGVTLIDALNDYCRTQKLTAAELVGTLQMP